MSPVKLQVRLQPAPAGLVRTAVRGQCRTVYVPGPFANEPVSGPGECVWTDGVASLFVKAHQGEEGLVIDLRVTADPPALLSTHRFVWLLSHDEVNQYLAPNLGAAHDLIVQPRWLKEGLPDGDCRALVVDLDSVAPGRLALQRLVKELSGRSHPYPVAAFGHNLEDDQIMDLRAAGIQVFQHGLCPAVFAAIAEQSSDGLSD
jgi:hypothetical protein